MALNRSETYSSLQQICDELPSGMDEEIAVVEAKLSKAHQLKQGMMQELLADKTRIV